MIFAPQPPNEDDGDLLHYSSGTVSIIVRRYMFGQYRILIALWGELFVFNPDIRGPEC